MRRPEHIKFLQPWGKNKAVKVQCTCDTSHGLESYPTFQMAMDTGKFDRYVKYWVANDQVSRVCRDFAERGTGIETLRGLLKFSI